MKLLVSYAVGCFLDMDATPARMKIFIDGEPLKQNSGGYDTGEPMPEVQCEYDFPKDGRAWFPSVAMYKYQVACPRRSLDVDALYSCAI